MYTQQKMKLFHTIFLLFFVAFSLADAARLKDIATFDGASYIQLTGQGLVSGLNNTGDSQGSRFTLQIVANYLKRFGITVPQLNFFNMRIRNVAAVNVSATIPVFLKKGGRIDVIVSTLGDATSLQGGVLIMSPLSSVDGTVYAVAQGPLSVGGYSFRSAGSQTGKNFVTTARIPNGGILERDVEGTIVTNGVLRVLLNEPDWTTASRVATSINSVQGLANAATATDKGAIEVKLPTGSTQPQIMQLIEKIEALEVQTDIQGRIVLNERTGTVVTNGAVRLLPGVVAHGGLEIQVETENTITQPNPFTLGGQPGRATNSTLTANEQNKEAIVIPASQSVQDIAAALNLLKVSPRDLIAIFQALKEAGVLQGELIIQ